MRQSASAAAAIGCVVLLGAALALDVHTEPPRVRVAWAPTVTSPSAAALEHGLVDSGRVDDPASQKPQVFIYRVTDPSEERMAALRRDPRVSSVAVDSAGPRATVRFRWRGPSAWREALQLQTVSIFVLAFIVLVLSAAKRRHTRRIGVIACCLVMAAIAWSLPLQQKIRMGDIETYTMSRQNFERYIASSSTVRFEAHLSTLLLRMIDRALGATDRTPIQSFRILGVIASGWFAAMLILAAWAGGWSPAALRYVAVAAAIPSAVLYFGYRELAHLSLNPAVFPLIVAGFRRRAGRFEGGSALAGLGAALHGFGVLALAGIAAAALSVRVRVVDRLRLLATAAAVGTTAYIGWLFIYIVLMHLSVVPGHAESVLFRPLRTPALAEHRVNEALMSLQGAREATVAAWSAGLLLVIPAVVAAATLRVRAVPALMYALPSAAFVVAFWPIQGLAVEADLVVAAFPGAYALAWLASRSSRTTWYALLILATAHIVFWRTMLGDVFVNARVY